MVQNEFMAILERPDGVGTWTFVSVPVDITERLGGRGQIKVEGTINGAAFRSTLLPRGDGSHYLVVPRPLREQLEVSTGSKVQVSVAPDEAPRPIAVPEDLLRVLKQRPGAEAAFEKMAPSHRKAYVEWIESAKRLETRERRLTQAVEMICEGRKLKG